MIIYIVKRLFWAVPVLFIASILIFSIVHLIPGNPVYLLLPPDNTPEQVEAMMKLYDFDKPIYVQYMKWLGNIFQGNLGQAITTGQSVAKLIQMKIGPTFQLAISAFILSFLIALPLGIHAGMKPEGFLSRRGLSIFTSFGLAMPSFWLGILLILLFGVTLGWLPTTGYYSFSDNPLKALKFILLPAFTQAIPASVIYSNFISSSVAAVRNSEYVIAARARGIPKRQIIVKHILKNAMIPVVTISAINFGRLMAGAVITENIFSIPGLGRLLVESIGARDYTVVQIDLLLIVTIFIIANLVADILNGWLDPRIRLK